VITMEFLGGMKPNDKQAFGLPRAIDPQDVVQELMRVYTTMILARGFFQADPHPGQHLRQSAPRGRTAGWIPRFVLLGLRPLQGAAGRDSATALFNLMFALMTTNEGRHGGAPSSRPRVSRPGRNGGPGHAAGAGQGDEPPLAWWPVSRRIHRRGDGRTCSTPSAKTRW